MTESPPCPDADTDACVTLETAWSKGPRGGIKNAFFTFEAQDGSSSGPLANMLELPVGQTVTGQIAAGTYDVLVFRTDSRPRGSIDPTCRTLLKLEPMESERVIIELTGKSDCRLSMR